MNRLQNNPVKMENEFIEKYQRNKKIWDTINVSYEEHIVSGHPDIVAYEKFEEKFLDNILLYLTKNSARPLKLIDIGCGSGRLHIRYGKKVKIPSLEIVKGIDFSEKMLELLQLKLELEGIEDLFYPSLEIEQGSAFDLQPESDTYFPIAVNLINTIGIMQGEEGAQKLFKSMRSCVEKAGGIAIISCYQKEYIKTYALPQYESTLDVSGQPIWLKPTSYKSEKYTLRPKYFKRANNEDLYIEVEVFENNELIKPKYLLYRDKALTVQTIKSGKIKTHTDYESNWFSFSKIENWIQKYWKGLPSYHIPTREIDDKNAEASQLAILDVNNILKGFDTIAS